MASLFIQSCHASALSNLLTRSLPPVCDGRAPFAQVIVEVQRSLLGIGSRSFTDVCREDFEARFPCLERIMRSTLWM